MRIYAGASFSPGPSEALDVPLEPAAEISEGNINDVDDLVAEFFEDFEAVWQKKYGNKSWAQGMSAFPMLHNVNRLKQKYRNAPAEKYALETTPGSKANLKSYNPVWQEMILSTISYYMKHFSAECGSIERVIELINDSHPEMKLRPRTVFNWKKKEKNPPAATPPLKHNGRPPKVTPEFEEDLKARLIFTVLEQSTGNKKAQEDSGELFERVYNICFSLDDVCKQADILAADPKWNEKLPNNIKFSLSWASRFCKRHQYVRRKITTKSRGALPGLASILDHDDTIYEALKDFAAGSVAMGDETAVRADPPTHQFIPKKSAKIGLRAQAPPNADDRLTVTAMVAVTDLGFQLPTFNIMSHGGKATTDLSRLRLLKNLMEDGPDGDTSFSESNGWVHKFWTASLKLKFKGDSIAKDRVFIVPFLKNTVTGCVVTAQTSGWMDAVRLCMYFDLVVKPYMENHALQRFAYVYDNCSSHLAPAVLEFAAKLGVTLVMLHPYTTPIRCILDIDVNKLLKKATKDAVAAEWIKQIQNYREQVALAAKASKPPPAFKAQKASVRSIIRTMRNICQSSQRYGLNHPTFRKTIADRWVTLGFRNGANGQRVKLETAFPSAGATTASYDHPDFGKAVVFSKKQLIVEDNVSRGLNTFKLLGFDLEWVSGGENCEEAQIDLDETVVPSVATEDSDVNSASESSGAEAEDDDVMSASSVSDDDIAFDDNDPVVPSFDVPLQPAAAVPPESRAGASSGSRSARVQLSRIFDTVAEIKQSIGLESRKRRADESLSENENDRSAPEHFPVNTRVEWYVKHIKHNKGRDLNGTYYQGVVVEVLQRNRKYKVLFDDGDKLETLAKDMRAPQVHLFQPKCGEEVFARWDKHAFPKVRTDGKWYVATVVEAESDGQHPVQPQFRCRVTFKDQTNKSDKAEEMAPTLVSEWIHVSSHVRELIPEHVANPTKSYHASDLWRPTAVSSSSKRSKGRK
jgi:hypothetical protein